MPARYTNTAVATPHALCDWGVAQGRLPLRGRGPFMTLWRIDPLCALGYLLAQPPRMNLDRPCPLLHTDPVEAERAKKRHESKRKRAEQIATVMEFAVSTTAEALGSSIYDDDIAEAIAANINAAAKDAAYAKRSRLHNRAKAAKTGSGQKYLDLHADDIERYEATTADAWRGARTLAERMAEKYAVTPKSAPSEEAAQ